MNRITHLLLGLALSFGLTASLSAKTALKLELEENLKVQLARCTAADESGYPPIMIFTMNANTPNSVGGVDATIGFKATGPKTIKYVHFEITMLNRVGDPAICRIRGAATQRLIFTGPTTKGKWEPYLRFKCVVYNQAATFVRMDAVRVIFMDGSEELFEGEKVLDLLTFPGTNDFSANVQQRIKTSVSEKGRFDVSGVP